MFVRARVKLFAVLLTTALVSVPTRAAWQPVPGNIMTRWAANVTPTNVWPEYPRPQMTRTDWMNLNGLWQFQAAVADEKPPVGKTLTEEILVPFPVESALSGLKRHVDEQYRK